MSLLREFREKKLPRLNSAKRTPEVGVGIGCRCLLRRVFLREKASGSRLVLHGSQRAWLNELCYFCFLDVSHR
jgi:hypothetical protein